MAIIDDQPITRAGMERVLADEPGFAIGASVSSVDEIDTLDGAGAYGVAVVAISARDARSCVDIVISVSKVARPVVISTWDGENMLWDAIRAGARGCVTRSCDQREMVMALGIAATGALYVSPDLIGHLHEQLGRPRRPGREVTVGLAPREIETARLISLGLTQRQIATRMGLSEATVNTYAKRIRSKLKVGNKAELTRAAIGLGLVGDDCGDLYHAA
ncbi:response regulator transcription factor [Micromonospora fulviviridis]|uniref:Response regulator transcription factor n=1 Tax=Micromonospora fulviviridis TaxID=47860 RepID=A0ABV2VHC2_9ACTN